MLSSERAAPSPTLIELGRGGLQVGWGAGERGLIERTGQVQVRQGRGTYGEKVRCRRGRVEPRRSGDGRTWKCGNVETWRGGDGATWGCGEAEMWRGGDVARWRRSEVEIRGGGDAARGISGQKVIWGKVKTSGYIEVTVRSGCSVTVYTEGAPLGDPRAA